jgi:hypothetical protein
MTTLECVPNWLMTRCIAHSLMCRIRYEDDNLGTDFYDLQPIRVISILPALLIVCGKHDN